MSTCSLSLAPNLQLNKYASIVERIIENINVNQYPHCSKEMLREIGYVSLIEASHKHNIERKSFRCYAKIFIQGRIINHLFSL